MYVKLKTGKFPVFVAGSLLPTKRASHLTTIPYTNKLKATNDLISKIRKQITSNKRTNS